MANKELDIAMFPILYSHIYDNNLSILASPRPFGFLYTDYILSLKQTGYRPIFRYFSTFDVSIWSLILLSILIISLVMALYIKSFKAFLMNFWLFSSILLSELFPKIALNTQIIYSQWNKLLIGLCFDILILLMSIFGFS